jgi:hypothetical protein
MLKRSKLVLKTSISVSFPLALKSLRFLGRTVFAWALRLSRRLRLSALVPPIGKAFVFSLTLTLAALYGGFFWPAVFVLSALYWYFQSLFDWKTFLYSFIVLVFYAYLGTSFFSGASQVSGVSGDTLVFLAASVFGILFFLLLSIKEFVFLRRQAIFNFMSGALYFFVAAVFFIADKDHGGSFLFYYLLSFIALYLLIKESIDFFMEDAPKKKKNLLVIGSAVLVAEFLSIISMLPIGFLSSAALIILIIFILEDLVYYHLKGALDRQIILNNVTILIISLIFIFATAKLSL